MARAFLVVMDSVGIGGAPDADKFFNGDVPDTGANTVGHIAQACAAGEADQGRSGLLNLPNLVDLGLGKALSLASGSDALGADTSPNGFWAVATEISKGKDTPSGHWELAGVPVPWDWHYFPDERPAFPDHVTKALCKAAGTDAILGNEHASGTEVIERLGADHVRTGYPICYTSADSVLQIAAHEELFGLDRLLDMCRAVAPLLHDMKVGRVIARPFVGNDGAFERTPNRRDFAISPPEPTLCDWVKDAGVFSQDRLERWDRLGEALANVSVVGEGLGVGEELVEDDTEGPEVSAWVLRVAEPLFRGFVGRGAGEAQLRGEVGVGVVACLDLAERGVVVEFA